MTVDRLLAWRKARTATPVTISATRALRIPQDGTRVGGRTLNQGATQGLPLTIARLEPKTTLWRRSWAEEEVLAMICALDAAGTAIRFIWAASGGRSSPKAPHSLPAAPAPRGRLSEQRLARRGKRAREAEPMPRVGHRRSPTYRDSCSAGLPVQTSSGHHDLITDSQFPGRGNSNPGLEATREVPS